MSTNNLLVALGLLGTTFVVTECSGPETFRSHLGSTGASGQAGSSAPGAAGTTGAAGTGAGGPFALTSTAFTSGMEIPLLHK